MAEKAVSVEVQYWLDRISEYEREFKKWEGRAEKIIKRYKDDRGQQARSQSGTRFNVLWANVQTLVPATYSRLPQPDVSRRFRDNDPVGRVASLIVERGLEYEIQHYPWYRSALRSCVQDRFLGGRGTCWVRYEPTFKRAQTLGLPEDGAQITEDVEAEGEQKSDEQLDYECSPVDYVHWKDFGHVVARTWEEVPAIWRKVYLTRDMCVERFGKDIGSKIPLDSKPDERANKNYTNDTSLKALVFEIWDKTQKKAIWLSKSLGEIVDEMDDPLQLEGFFPSPRPLFATITNDSLVPVPYFVMYQDQAAELDTLADRIDGLVKALQVKGVYNAEYKELARLFTEGTNTDLIPVKAWNSFAEKQGLKGAIDIVDIEPIAAALVQAYEAFAQIRGQIDQLSGVIDVMRGEVDPDEKLGQTRMKGNTSSLRLRNMQEDVAMFATEILQIMAQIMCGQYEPNTLTQIAAVQQLSPEDQQVVPQALELLMGQRAQFPDLPPSINPLRSFRIEVAADTLVQMDEAQEKVDRMEFLKANGEFMSKAQQMIAGAGAAAPIVAPVVMELWKFGVSGFKVGKTVEGVIDECADKLRKLAQNPPPPPPDPKLEAVKAQTQAKQQEMQQEGQLRIQELQQEAAIREREIQAEAARNAQQQAMEQHREETKMIMENAFARFEALLKAKTAVEVAEISAGATVDSAQISAANQATQQ